MIVLLLRNLDVTTTLFWLKFQFQLMVWKAASMSVLVQDLDLHWNQKKNVLTILELPLPTLLTVVANLRIRTFQDGL